MLKRFIASSIMLSSLAVSILSLACSSRSSSTTAATATGRVAVSDSALSPSVISSPAVASPSVRRFIIVLLDASKSFLYLDNALNQVERIVAALGPSDTVLIAKITGTFDPAINILIERSLPDLPAEYLKIPTNLRAQNEQQSVLNALWRVIEAQKQEIIAISRKMELQVLKTDLHTALAYSAQRFEQAGDMQKHLLLFTDLEQDARGVKTSQPPGAAGLNLKGTRVMALFVPWYDASTWTQLMQAWQGWAAGRGAQSFSMHDPAQSSQMQLLSPAAAPKTVPAAFLRDPK